MIVPFALGLGALALLATARRPAAAPANPPAPADPVVPPVAGPTASSEGWVQLQDAPGLEVRAPSRSWTSPAVRELLLAAGKVAAQLGGKLHLGDVGPAERGTVFEPHKSHRWGRDIDIAYTLEAYPTPIEVPVDPRVVAVLDSLAPWIEVVGVNAARLPPFTGRAFKAVAWDGHARHLHLRLRPELVAEVKPVAFGGLLELDQVDEDNDD